MDLNILYLFLILCHIKPFKTDNVDENGHVMKNEIKNIIENMLSHTSFTGNITAHSTDEGSFNNSVEIFPNNNIEVEFNIETEDNFPISNAKTKLDTSTDTYKSGKVIRIEDLRRLFQELGVQKQVLREASSRTVTPTKGTTTIVTTAKMEPAAEDADDKLIKMKDLKMAINDLKLWLTARFNTLQSKPTSSATNEKDSAKVYNLMDFIKIGRGEKLSPKPRTDNLNWLKIKVPFTN